MIEKVGEGSSEVILQMSPEDVQGSNEGDALVGAPVKSVAEASPTEAERLHRIQLAAAAAASAREHRLSRVAAAAADTAGEQQRGFLEPAPTYRVHHGEEKERPQPIKGGDKLKPGAYSVPERAYGGVPAWFREAASRRRSVGRGQRRSLLQRANSGPAMGRRCVRRRTVGRYLLRHLVLLVRAGPGTGPGQHRRDPLRRNVRRNHFTDPRLLVEFEICLDGGSSGNGGGEAIEQDPLIADAIPHADIVTRPKHIAKTMERLVLQNQNNLEGIKKVT